MKTVLVTRPEPGATSTASKLRALGFDPIVLPMTEICPLSAALPDDRFDAIFISSAQAVRLLPQPFPAKLLALPLYAVGTASGGAATKAGFTNVIHEHGNAEALIDKIVACLPVGSRLLYLCGKVRRPDTERALADAGYLLAAVETYNTRPHAGAAALSPAMSGTRIDFILVTSVLSSIGLNQLGAFAQAHYLCLSRRIADALVGVETDFIHIAREPNEESLLNLAMQIADFPLAL